MMRNFPRFTLLASAVIAVLSWQVEAALEQELVDRADESFSAGRYDEAGSMYASIVAGLTEAEDIVPISRKLAASQIAGDRLVEAGTTIDRLVTKWPDYEWLPHAMHDLVKQAVKMNKGAQVRSLLLSLMADPAGAEQDILLEMAVGLLDVSSGNDAAVAAGVESIASNFAEDKRAAEVLGQIGWAYRDKGRHDKALEIYELVTSRWSGQARAVYSQRGVFLCRMALGDGDGAWRAAQELLNGYADSDYKADALSQVAEKYEAVKLYARASEIRQYIVGNLGSSDSAMPSQGRLVVLKLKSNDSAGADEAIDRLLSAYGSRDDFAQVAVETGDSCRRGLKGYAQARRLYSYVLANCDDDPAAMWAMRGLAHVDVLEARYDSAERRLSELTQRYADHADLDKALMWSANDFMSARLYEKAALLYSEIKEQFAGGDTAFEAQRSIIAARIRGQDFNGADAAIDEMFEAFSGRSDLAVKALGLGDRCRREFKSVEQARKLYQGLLDRCSQSSQAMWARRGIAYLEIASGDMEAAETSIAKLLTDYGNHPELAKAFYWLGNDFFRAGRYDKAREMYNHVLSTYPESSEAVYASLGLVVASIQTGNEADPEVDVQTLTGQFAGERVLPLAVLNLGEYYYNRHYYHMSKGDEQAAIAAMRKAVATWELMASQMPDNPHTAEAWYMAGRGHENLTEYPQAIECYGLVMENWPSFKRIDAAHYLSARCWAKLAEAESISSTDAATIICELLESHLTNYPGSELRKAAGNLLAKWQKVR